TPGNTFNLSCSGLLHVSDDPAASAAEEAVTDDTQTAAAAARTVRRRFAAQNSSCLLLVCRPAPAPDGRRLCPPRRAAAATASSPLDSAWMPVLPGLSWRIASALKGHPKRLSCRLLCAWQILQQQKPGSQQQLSFPQLSSNPADSAAESQQQPAGLSGPAQLGKKIAADLIAADAAAATPTARSVDEVVVGDGSIAETGWLALGQLTEAGGQPRQPQHTPCTRAKRLAWQKFHRQSQRNHELKLSYAQQLDLAKLELRKQFETLAEADKLFCSLFKLRRDSQPLGVGSFGMVLLAEAVDDVTAGCLARAQPPPAPFGFAGGWRYPAAPWQSKFNSTLTGEKRKYANWLGVPPLTELFNCYGAGWRLPEPSCSLAGRLGQLGHVTAGPPTWLHHYLAMSCWVKNLRARFQISTPPRSGHRRLRKQAFLSFVFELPAPAGPD
uniref:Protein kinase domain-containing protein n=1 Tax=Macrostomum lignano TaxID=282301 RepID=A0A1I8JN21_9PLAT